MEMETDGVSAADSDSGPGFPSVSRPRSGWFHPVRDELCARWADGLCHALVGVTNAGPSPLFFLVVFW